MLSILLAAIVLLGNPTSRPTAATPHDQKPFRVGMTTFQAQRAAREWGYKFQIVRTAAQQDGRQVRIENWRNQSGGWPEALNFEEGNLKGIVTDNDTNDIRTADQVIEGMDRATVIDIMGPPARESTSSDGVGLCEWRYFNDNGRQTGSAVVHFREGHVSRIDKHSGN
jgi:hypothetical protein